MFGHNHWQDFNESAADDLSKRSTAWDNTNVRYRTEMQPQCSHLLIGEPQDALQLFIGEWRAVWSRPHHLPLSRPARSTDGRTLFSSSFNSRAERFSATWTCGLYRACNISKTS